MNQQYPLDDASFDLISVIYQKSKALEAYKTYEKDAQTNSELKNLLNEMAEQDRRQVERLKECLSKMLAKKGS